MMGINWWAFVVVVFFAYVIPGPDFAVILRASTRSSRAGLAAALGAQTGLCVHMALAALGLSLLLARSPDVLTAVRLVGAGYLTFLGLRILWFTRGTRRALDEISRDPASLPTSAAFAQGFFTNVLNPKAILFFASVLPQFLSLSGPATAQIFVLGSVDIAIGLVLWSALVAVGSRLGSLLREPSIRRRWDRATGGVLAALGVIVASAKA
jgi:threonine/homoserine/homoserine lactone efflux protein